MNYPLPGGGGTFSLGGGGGGALGRALSGIFIGLGVSAIALIPSKGVAVCWAAAVEALSAERCFRDSLGQDCLVRAGDLDRPCAFLRFDPQTTRSVE